MYIFYLNVNGQLRNQVITSKANVLSDTAVIKSNEEINRLSTIQPKIAPRLIIAGTNILVNTITRVIKNRIM